MVNLCGKSAAAGPRVLSREATLCSKEDPHCTGYARIQGKGFAGFIFFAWLPWNFFSYHAHRSIGYRIRGYHNRNPQLLAESAATKISCLGLLYRAFYRELLPQHCHYHLQSSVVAGLAPIRASRPDTCSYSFSEHTFKRGSRLGTQFLLTVTTRPCVRPSDAAVESWRETLREACSTNETYKPRQRNRRKPQGLAHKTH